MLWLKNFMCGLQVVKYISRLLKMYCDNSAVVFFTKNNERSQSKYIGIKYLTLRERIKGNEVFIEHISIELMNADPLAKYMSQKMFKDHGSPYETC